MSTSTAIASASLSQSMSNTIKLKEMECNQLINSFDLKSSTIEQKQNLAECINTLYPKSFTEVELLLIKITFIIAVIGLICGIVKAYKEKEDYLMYVIYAFGGLILFPIISSILIAIGFGIKALF